MIGKDQKLIIHWRWETYNTSSIKLEMDGMDEDTPEAVGYLLVEALGHFLADIRKVLPSEQKSIYNEYVQDLHNEMEKVLIAKYEDV